MAINATTIEVTFNQPVDSVSAENFTIEGADVTAANLSEDKTKATLRVSGLAYETEYTLVSSAVVNGEVVNLGSSKFTTLGVTDLWTLVIEAKESKLIADGADNTEVTFKLLNAEGEVDTSADNVVLDLNTTYGALASKRVTIQDGVATVLLTSEFSNTELTAKIDAQIIEASGDYKDLIGKVVATYSIDFVTTDTDNVETVTLVSAESNQADRLTLFFDKDVSIKHLVAVDEDTDEILYSVDTDGDFSFDKTSLTAKEVIDGKYKAHQIYHQLKETDSIEVKQGNGALRVKGVRAVAGNSKAIEVIFDSANDPEQVLKDNATVKVEVKTVNSLGKKTPSAAEFKLTDARRPEATSVTAEDLNTLKVKFSESIHDTDFTIDAKWEGVKVATVDAIDSKVTELNIQAVPGTPDEKNAFVYATGDFNPVTGIDQRDLATIKLTKHYDEDGIDDSKSNNKTLMGYFSAGLHSLQISSIKDYAWITDKSNLGSTQSLNFTIHADETKPNATVVVESPEQIRVKFDKVVSGLTKDDLKLQIFNPTTGEYEDITVDTFEGLENPLSGDFDFVKQYMDIQPITGGSEYVIELTEDWTKIYKTSETRENYYNDKFRLVIAKNAVANVANGITNDVINLDLNYVGSPLNAPDTTSPEVVNVKLISAEDGTFEVTMSEPVKAVVYNDVRDMYEDVDHTTPAEGQTPSQASIVYLYGKDKDGKTVTFTGKVTGYADKDGADKVLAVTWNPITVNDVTHTPQTIVDAGGSTLWEISVANLTDDVGNAASTKVFKFTIDKTPASASPFYVTYTGTGDNRVYNVIGKLNGDKEDTITITFSEGVQVAGSSNATNPAQYTLNGEYLPAGTSIKAYDRDGNADNGSETVVITLPDGTLNGLTTESNTITINKGLVSYDGSLITGATELIVTVEDAVDSDLQDVIDAANDAISAANAALADAAGNTAVTSEITEVQNARTALQEALNKVPQDADDIEAFTEALELAVIALNQAVLADALATAQTNAKAELDNYVDANDYKINATVLANAIAAGKTAIDGAPNEAAVTTALNEAKTAIDGIVADADVDTLTLSNLTLTHPTTDSSNTVTLATGETLVVTSNDNTDAVATAKENDTTAGQIDVTTVATGGPITITVQVVKEGQVIKQGTFTVTVN